MEQLLKKCEQIALNPKDTKVKDNPSINKNVFITVLFPLLKIPKYTGTIGKMHGEKKDTSPAVNIPPINKCCSNIFFLLLNYFIRFTRYP